MGPDGGKWPGEEGEDWEVVELLSREEGRRGTRARSGWKEEGGRTFHWSFRYISFDFPLTFLCLSLTFHYSLAAWEGGEGGCGGC